MLEMLEDLGADDQIERLVAEKSEVVRTPHVGVDARELMLQVGDVVGVEIAPKELVRCRTPRDVHTVIAQAAAR